MACSSRAHTIPTGSINLLDAPRNPMRESATAQVKAPTIVVISPSRRERAPPETLMVRGRGEAVRSVRSSPEAGERWKRREKKDGQKDRGNRGRGGRRLCRCAYGAGRRG